MGKRWAGPTPITREDIEACHEIVSQGNNWKKLPWDNLLGETEKLINALTFTLNSMTHKAQATLDAESDLPKLAKEIAEEIVGPLEQRYPIELEKLRSEESEYMRKIILTHLEQKFGKRE